MTSDVVELLETRRQRPRALDASGKRQLVLRFRVFLRSCEQDRVEINGNSRLRALGVFYLLLFLALCAPLVRLLNSDCARSLVDPNRVVLCQGRDSWECRFVGSL